MQLVAVVDVGTGNLRSVERALERAAAVAGMGCRIEITACAEVIGRLFSAAYFIFL